MILYECKRRNYYDLKIFYLIWNFCFLGFFGWRGLVIPLSTPPPSLYPSPCRKANLYLVRGVKMAYRFGRCYFRSDYQTLHHSDKSRKHVQKTKQARCKVTFYRFKRCNCTGTSDFLRYTCNRGAYSVLYGLVHNISQRPDLAIRLLQIKEDFFLISCLNCWIFNSNG